MDCFWTARETGAQRTSIKTNTRNVLHPHYADWIQTGAFLSQETANIFRAYKKILHSLYIK